MTKNFGYQCNLASNVHSLSDKTLLNLRQNIFLRVVYPCSWVLYLLSVKYLLWALYVVMLTASIIKTQSIFCSNFRSFKRAKVYKGLFIMQLNYSKILGIVLANKQIQPIAMNNGYFQTKIM